MNKRSTERIPYGFMKHERYGVLVMNSEKIQVVKLMFSLCLDGMSLGQIKEVIESQGIEYPANTTANFLKAWSFYEPDRHNGSCVCSNIQSLSYS